MNLKETFGGSFQEFQHVQTENMFSFQIMFY